MGNTVTATTVGTMTDGERAVCGGVGSIVPLLASVAVMADLEHPVIMTVLLGPSFFLALTIKVICSVAVGSTVCYYRKQLRDRWSAFVWGAMAVGIFAGAINAGGKLAPLIFKTADAGPVARFSLLPIFSAWAQDTVGPSTMNQTERPFVYPICLPQPSEFEKFTAGFTGVIPNTLARFWVVESATDRGSAQRVQTARKGFIDTGRQKPRVFATFGSTGWHYFLSLGVNLSQEDAKDLANRYHNKFGGTFEVVQFSVLLSRNGIAPNALPVCHFSYDK